MNEQNRIVVETNMTAELQNEFFHYVDEDQPFTERKTPDLVLYDHPKKGLTVITQE
jgi:hypothetical protein